MLSLTTKMIQAWTGSTIYARGLDYYERGYVEDLTYNPKTQKASALIKGNYGHYEITVSLSKDELDGNCTCPYEGWPCKHLAAVCLAIVTHQPELLKQAQQNQNQEQDLIQKLQKLSKKELLDLVIQAQSKYPDFQRELLLRWGDPATINTDAIKKEIKHALAQLRHGSSLSRCARDLEKIWQSVQNTPASFRLEVLLVILDLGISTVSDYQIYDTPLDESLTEFLEALEALFEANPELEPQKINVLKILLKNYNGNTLEDNIYGTIEQIAGQDEHYHLIVEFLEARLSRSSSFSSYRKQQIAEWKSLLGDDAGRYELLSRDLKYGIDYWALAKYWIEKEEQAKAWKVVQEGIQKGIGRKEELYAFGTAHCKEDPKALLKLFDYYLADYGLSGYVQLEKSELYQTLIGHYQQDNDQKLIEKLFKSCINYALDLDLYISAQKQLNDASFAHFKTQYMNKLEKTVQASKTSYYTSQAQLILAQVYAYQGDTTKLFELIKGRADQMLTYEPVLINLYPKVYLDHYQKIVMSRIEARNRSAYKEAIQYLEKVRTIYTDHLKNKSAWTVYLNSLKSKYTTLKALHEELTKAGLN